MRLSVNGGEWAVAAHAAPCAPSAAAGAALFPVLCGDTGVRVRCNWGLDAARPLKHAPPSAEGKGEYIAVGLARQVQAAPAMATSRGDGNAPLVY
jgi:hypothetical protein